MENEKIIEILSEWNPWKKDLDVGIYRVSYLEKLDKLLETKQVISITGVRRSGKSTLIKQFIMKQISLGKKRNSFLYINLEELRFADMLNLEFLQNAYEAYIEIMKPTEKPFILLDEIHKISKWERFVRGLHERGESNIIISGSTSQLLSKELGALLTGRWLNLEVFPLDSYEFLEFNKIKVMNKADLLSQKIKIKQLLREYLEFGGFPLVVLSKEKEELLKRYFEDIVSRDVAERYKIRKPEKLKALAKYYLTSFSSFSSYRSIAKFIGLSLDSVERFSSFLSEAQLIFFVQKFSYSLKEQEVNLRKVYGIDTGLINIVSFRFSENIGRLYENIVFLSLLKRGNEIYYYKNRGECDFVVKKGQKILQLIQVSYQIEKNKEREIKGLLEAMEKLKVKEGFVITKEKEGKEIIKGKNIKYIPLWKWLII